MAEKEIGVSLLIKTILKDQRQGTANCEGELLLVAV